MNFPESLSLEEELRQDEGTYLLTREFFNVQSQCSRIRGYAEVTPEAVTAASEAIYNKQPQITNWLLDMPGSERYFGDKDAFRAAGKHILTAKTVADTKVTDAASFGRTRRVASSDPFGRPTNTECAHRLRVGVWRPFH